MKNTEGQRRGRGALAAALLAAAVAAAQGAACEQAAQSIPARPAQAPSGREFAAAVDAFDDGARDAAARAALLAGDLPEFLRRLVPLVVQGRRSGGAPVSLTLCVMPDYLGVGRDDDFVRIPIGLPSALAVATRFGLMLPTRRIVDLVYRHAQLRLTPQPLPPDERMRSIATVSLHHGLVEAQRTRAGGTLGMLTAGQKKDLVLTPRLLLDPGKVAIYGWHRSGGAPIQPLSTVHGERYADYSHGVRLVGAEAWVDGRPRALAAVLADPELAPLVSDEGPLPPALTTALAAR